MEKLAEGKLRYEQLPQEFMNYRHREYFAPERTMRWMTPLIWLTVHMRVPEYRALFRRWANDKRTQIDGMADGYIALMWAAEFAGSHSSVGAMDLLLDRGADPNKKDVQGEWSALGHAARFHGTTGSMAAVEFLLNRRADASLLSKMGNSVLQLSLWSNFSSDSIRTIQLLLDRGAEINLANRMNGRPLETVLFEKNSAIANTILEMFLDYQADPNFIGKTGNPPLVYAYKKGLIEAVFVLLSDPRTDYNFANSSGESLFALLGKTKPFHDPLWDILQVRYSFDCRGVEDETVGDPLLFLPEWTKMTDELTKDTFGVAFSYLSFREQVARVLEQSLETKRNLLFKYGFEPNHGLSEPHVDQALKGLMRLRLLLDPRRGSSFPERLASLLGRTKWSPNLRNYLAWRFGLKIRN